MARYIDADKLLDDLGLRKGITADEIINGIPEKGIRPMDEPHCWFFLSIILAPTADVVDVVRGEWIKPTDVMGFGRCSNCNALWDYSLIDNPFFNYCPNCGARMVEE